MIKIILIFEKSLKHKRRSLLILETNIRMNVQVIFANKKTIPIPRKVFKNRYVLAF